MSSARWAALLVAGAWLLGACAEPAPGSDTAEGEAAHSSEGAPPRAEGQTPSGGNGDPASAATPARLPAALLQCIDRAGIDQRPAASPRALAVTLAIARARCRPTPSELEQLATRISLAAP